MNSGMVTCQQWYLHSINRILEMHWILYKIWMLRFSLQIIKKATRCRIEHDKCADLGQNTHKHSWIPPSSYGVCQSAVMLCCSRSLGAETGAGGQCQNEPMCLCRLHCWLLWWQTGKLVSKVWKSVSTGNQPNCSVAIIHYLFNGNGCHRAHYTSLCFGMAWRWCCTFKSPESAFGRCIESKVNDKLCRLHYITYASSYYSNGNPHRNVRFHHFRNNWCGHYVYWCPQNTIKVKESELAHSLWI